MVNADISIIIPTFNKVELSRRCLESIQSQDIHCKIVVVDNGSVDGTVERIRANHPEVHLIENASNLGVTAAWNQGLAHVKSGIVGIVNNDIIFHKRSLERLTEPLLLHDWIGCTSPVTYQDRYDDLPFFAKGIIPESDALPKAGAFKIGYAGWCFFFRRADMPGRFWSRTSLWYQDKDFLYNILFHTRGRPPFRWSAVGKVPVVVQDAFVDHAHHASHGQLRPERIRRRTQKDRFNFNRRWAGNKGNKIAEQLPWGLIVRQEEPRVDVIHDGRQHAQNEILRISIIIPAYNRPLLLVQTLQSLLSSTYRSIEVIVVDDASEADVVSPARQILDGACEHVIVRLSHNSGPGMARQIGMRYARGEFIQYLDSDDVLHPDKLRQQLAFLAEHPGIDMTYCLSAVMIDSQRKKQIVGLTDHEYESILDAVFSGRMAWATSSCLWRRSTAATSESWASLFGGEDTYYYICNGILPLSIQRTPGKEPLLWIRTHLENMSRDLASRADYQLEILKMYDMTWEAIKDTSWVDQYKESVVRWYSDKIMRFLVLRRYHEVSYIIRVLRSMRQGLSVDVRLFDIAVRITGNVEIFGLLRRWKWLLRSKPIRALRGSRS